MRKYIIMGPQGCGKGTQAGLLASAYNLTHLSVGDIFRWNIQVHTKLAARIKRIMDAGQLVPDEIVEEIVQRRLAMHDWNYGMILDGFPRNAAQAEFFLESYDVDAVIHIDVPVEVTRQRALSRRRCSQCGLDYNLMHHRPQQDGICDVCGGELVARGDDTEEALQRRLDDYNHKTRPTLDLFERKELVVYVDGSGTIEETQARMRRDLGLPDPAILLATSARP
ncbi:MAG: nucleoside monophosphate kinase [Planctomycetota bacterium]